MLLNSAKLTAGKADVFEAIGAASKLHGLLRNVASSANPRWLGARALARMLYFVLLPPISCLACQSWRCCAVVSAIISGCISFGCSSKAAALYRTIASEDRSSRMCVGTLLKQSDWLIMLRGMCTAAATLHAAAASGSMSSVGGSCCCD